MSHSHIKKPGARTQYLRQPDGTKTPIRVRCINPQTESKYAKTVASRPKPAERRPAADS